MRISDSTLTELITNSMSKNYSTYADVIQKIANNKNFTKISENPTDATKVLKLDNQLSKLNIYQDNIQAATNEMSFTYETLGSIDEELTSINSLILEAANATTGTDSAKAIASEIEQRVKTIQDKLNSKYLDNYIFAGSYTSTIPFEEEENEEGVKVITYKGSPVEAGKRNLTIAENTPFQYNITGNDIFGTETYKFLDEDGVEQLVESDFFTQMADLNALLNADSLDYNKIREKIQVSTNAVKGVSKAQGQISAQVSKLDTAKELNDTTILNLTEGKSELQDVDILKAATDLANAQTALQASYTLGSRILSNVSLLDYI